MRNIKIEAKINTLVTVLKVLTISSTQFLAACIGYQKHAFE